MTPALARIVTDALRGGDRPVIGGPGISLGAREILDRADAIRKSLDRLGIAPDEPILVSVANRGADIAAFLGVWLAGGVVVPLHATAPAAVRDGLLGASGADRRYTVTRVLARWATVRPAYRISLRGGTELLASAEHRFLTERCAQIVGRLCHGTPRIRRSEDTTARQFRGKSGTAARQ